MGVNVYQRTTFTPVVSSHMLIMTDKLYKSLQHAAFTSHGKNYLNYFKVQNNSYEGKTGNDAYYTCTY